MQKTTFTFGYFLELQHIEGAFDLLKKQIEEDSPLYNTIDFKIFRNEKKIEEFGASDFYDNFIKNDVFYYFQNNIFIHEYYAVVSSYKTRKFHFLSFEMLIIYYAVGLYLAEILEDETDFNEILKTYKAVTVYGGKINYKEPKHSKITYYENYKKFLEKKQELSKNEDNITKYAITMDIKDFFYNINHKILLDIVEKNATSVNKEKKRYNQDTINSILFFFKYLMKKEMGIPVSSQNIISNYLSHIYFRIFDRYIIDNFLIKKGSNLSYIRYVDDFCLIYKTKNELPFTLINQRDFIYEIENEITYFLIKNLGLNINREKTIRKKIVTKEDYEDFMSVSDYPSLKEMSESLKAIQAIFAPNKTQNENETSKKIETLENCIVIIKMIKEQSSEFDKLKPLKREDDDELNQILIDASLLSLCKSKEIIKKLDSSEVFLKYYSLDYILFKVKVFLYLISLKEDYRQHLHKLLIDKNQKNVNQRIKLIELFVLQLEISNQTQNKKNNILEQEIGQYIQEYEETIKMILNKDDNQHAKLVLKMLDNSFKLSEFDTIYNIAFLSDENNISLMQQIKQKNLNEFLGNFNVAFNHLLNEFQSFFQNIYLKNEEVDADKIKKVMIEERFTTDEILFVNDFFKRRNQNSISHTNYSELGFLAVREEEYWRYKKRIIEIIKNIISKKIQ